MTSDVRNLYIHRDLNDQLAKVQQSYPHSLVEKTRWAQRELVLYGRTPRVKGTVGHECAWRRTPIQGNHFYLWWIPHNVRGAEPLCMDNEAQAIFVRTVRHHDDTDKPLDIGSLEDYELVGVNQIDPLYEDQRSITVAIANSASHSVRVISGTPGSGKTIAIQYATSSLADRIDSTEPTILYVTYTEPLAEEARTFFQAYTGRDAVCVYTLADIEAKFAAEQPPSIKPILAKQNYELFEEFYSHATKPQLGAWYGHLPSLWTEMRAFLFGMTLPYPWKRGGEREIPAGTILNFAAYAEIRKDFLDEKSASVAHRLAKKMYEQGAIEACLGEQIQAYRVLQRIMKDSSLAKETFGHIDAIIVDEVQDLTVVQIALLAELGKTCSEGSGIKFVVAGDESQTIEPSGFDWGITKDLLASRLDDKNPQELPLRSQRRSPPRLSQLVQDSWGLYQRYLKNSRGIPRDRQVDSGQAELQEEKLILLQKDASTDWAEIVQICGALTDIAIVDLTGSLQATLDLSDDVRKTVHRIVYSPRQIKGLDRKTILVIGLDHVLSHLEKDREISVLGGDVSVLENRKRIDEIRVALSRSTHTLVLAAEQCETLSERLKLSDIVPVPWQNVREHLLREYQDIDAFEKVADRLHAADESMVRGEYERAQSANTEARNLLVELQDVDLIAQADKQRRKIEQNLAKVYLRRIDSLLASSEHELAERVLQLLKDVLGNVDSPEVHERANSFEQEIAVWRQIKDVEKEIEGNRYQKAYEIYTDAQNTVAQCVLDEYAEERLATLLSKQEENLKPKYGSMAKSWWTDAKGFLAEKDYERLVCSLRWISRVRHHQGNPESASLFECLEERYERICPPVSLEAVPQLLKYILKYLDVLTATHAIDKPEARQFIFVWLSESMILLKENPTIFGQCAEQYRQIFKFQGIEFLRTGTNKKPGKEESDEENEEEGRRRIFLEDAQQMLDAGLAVLREHGFVDDALAMAHIFELFLSVKAKSVIKPLQSISQSVQHLQDDLRNLYPAERRTIAARVKTQVKEMGNTPPLIESS